MKRILFILMATALLTGAADAFAQRMQDGSYRTVGYIKSDGTVQDGSYRTIGYVKKDGTVQDASYRTIGYARDIPRTWAAFYFFFKL